jgi:hemolysin D
MQLKLKWQAWQDLWKRYTNVFSFYWQNRKQLTVPELHGHEAEFLPSALAIEHRPVSPGGRLVAWILMTLVLVVFLWSVLGQVDIVVNGAGKIIPQGHTKTISSVETAKVATLNIVEGQKVKQGEVLIELDTRASESDRLRADADHQLATLQIQRSKALLNALDTNKTPKLLQTNDVDQAYFIRESQHLEDQWQDYQAKKKRLEAQIKRYQSQLPLAEKRASDYFDLLKEKDVSEHAWLEKQLAFLDIKGQLSDTKTQLLTLITETRKSAQEELLQATRIGSESNQEIQKAAARTDQLKLVSPVDGTVQQLTVHTLGGVVSAGQPLMNIVPESSEVEFEAFIENKDIGFIQEGQNVQVKIDAFQYTKYGTVAAVVKHVSKDAIDPAGNAAINNLDKKSSEDGGKKELVYSVRVALEQANMDIDGKLVALTPGLSGSVEILTGKRRVIEYLISPLITHTRESMRER